MTQEAVVSERILEKKTCEDDTTQESRRQGMKRLTMFYSVFWESN